MRGEHPCGISRRTSRRGSSPHARGALYEYKGDKRFKRIIPACAGSTRAEPNQAREVEDHPRMRGEHFWMPLIADCMTGSSPHARGAQVQGRVPVQGQGIIPACAGSTSLPSRSWSRRRDHPRMRGEHGGRRAQLLPDSGSSPHARGALRRQRQRGSRAGIIPACAGSTAGSW